MPSALFRRFLYWVPALIYMGVIFYLSNSRAPEFFDYINYRFFFIKFLHLVEYGVLGALYYYALRKTSGLSHLGALWVSVVLAGAFGFGDEWHQSFIVGRNAMPLDVLTDILGAYFGGKFAGYFKISRSAEVSA